jgi:glycosyltransferase involved in cell wall biosynthesis
MKLLFISPLPPPISGQSKVGQIVLDSLDSSDTYIVNLGKAIEVNRFTNFFRAFYILKALFKVNAHKNNCDVIYISLAESFLGNIRDLSIYWLCRKRLNKVVIHMLGGTSMRKILKNDNFLGRANKYFISRVGAVIVEGSMNYKAFSNVVPKEKIHIIPNFAEDFVFTTENKITQKFKTIDDKINILYLSNLLPGKGYLELLDAFLMLTPEVRKRFTLKFVGGFENKIDEEKFLQKLSNQKDISYLGKFIDHTAKVDLYNESHIMCLPTYYIAEGLPIAILEAYAAGISVITTYHSGIPDVFKDEINGYVVEPNNPSSIIKILNRIYKDPILLQSYAINNYHQALQNHRVEKFVSAVMNIFKSLN